MPKVSDAAIDEIVASCNGDIRGALKALILVNERLEMELERLYASALQKTVESQENILH